MKTFSYFLMEIITQISGKIQITVFTKINTQWEYLASENFQC